MQLFRQKVKRQNILCITVLVAHIIHQPFYQQKAQPAQGTFLGRGGGIRFGLRER